MISYIIQVSVCWALFYLGYLLFYRRETFFKYNRLYLILGLLGGLIIPFFEIPIALTGDTSLVVEQFMAPIQAEAFKMEEFVNMSSSPIFVWKDLIFAFYLLGFLFFSRRFIIGLLEIRRLYVGAEKIFYPNYTLASTGLEHLPFTFFSILFWSKKMEMRGLDKKVFNHEMAHIKQWHSLDIIFIEILSILFWFNPMLFIYKKALRDTHEYLADNVVTRQEDKKEYGRFLVESKVSSLQLSLANHFIQSQLKNRINMIFKSPSNQKHIWKYLLIIPMFAIIAGLYSFKYSPEHGENLIQTSQLSPLNNDTTLLVVVFPNFFLVEANTPELEAKKLAYSTHMDKITSSSNKSVAMGEAGISVHAQQHSKKELDAVIAQFNPDEIESVRILKGDSFHQKYPDKEGSQAIIITLKNKFELIKLDETSKVDLSKEELFKVVEEMPRFPGCEEGTTEDIKGCAQKKLLEYMYKNIQYPKAARDAGIQGHVVVKFVVEKDGSLSDFEILRDIGAGCGEEALRVLQSMNNMEEKWRPGYQKGKAVRVQFNMPVKYKLAEDKEKMKPETSLEKANETPQEIFKVVEEMPRFPGCEAGSMNIDELKKCSQENLLKFIYTNIKYPKVARNAAVQGQVIVKFVVEKDGTLSNIEVIRDIGATCGDEAKRVVQLINDQGLKWTPGKQRGRDVRVQFNLPIKFKLSGEAKAKTPQQPQKVKSDNATVSSLAISEASKLKSFNLAPNPNSGKFQLQFITEIENPKVQIYNLTGSVVKEKELTGRVGELIETTMEMRNISPGSFILQIPGKRQSYTHKFIIK
jgi:TonB family protein